ncbi:MAG: YebC/PmpR family DNA-binding transcriptional regulator [Patescibacteria group bacterium]|nr:YebC/PmpR family DNA-binding transcriptional regulator [Patescibacteria group bacterium]MBU1876811.1 YebC/PmpR family DNA-binding transcriptional regulator [Patescibacteria group bacterium]
MSGHSHWSTIKHQKGAADVKRGQIFSKMAKLISIAVKEGGVDPDKNPKLRLAIEKAKSLNMPKDNIDRSIKKGSGELDEGIKLEEITLELFGPSGIAIIIETITDNKNRTFSEIKKILNLTNGKLAGEGSVKWLFDRKGVLIANAGQTGKTEEELELMVIEAGAEDMNWHDNSLVVITKIDDLEKIKGILSEKEIIIESASLDWVAKKSIDLPEKERAACEKLFELLDENDSVQDIYSNLT